MVVFLEPISHVREERRMDDEDEKRYEGWKKTQNFHEESEKRQKEELLSSQTFFSP